MAEDIKNLIEKIHREGVVAAQNKAEQIEDRANQTAKQIIDKANSQAQQILADAKKNVAQMEHSANASLKQSGRDLLLSLRKEINAMLDKIIASSIQDALEPEELADILKELINNCDQKDKNDIIISLKKQDLQSLEKGFLSKLKNQTKRKIVLQHSEDIQGGFIISYDSGKSHYDFTDKSLAEYISAYLDPKLRELLKESVSKK